METRAFPVRREGASPAAGARGGRSRIGALILVVASLAAACGSAGATPPVAPITLEGTVWRAVLVNGLPPDPGAEPTAAFKGGEVQGSTGCNDYDGSFAQSPGTVKVGEIRSTLRACLDRFGGNRGFTAQGFVSAMVGATTVNVDASGRLVIEGPGGAITFEQIVPIG